MPSNIDTYKGFRPRFTGEIISDGTGRRWRLSLIPIDLARKGLDYPTTLVQWSNQLAWRIGRGDENRPSPIMAASCEVALKDPSGFVSDWLFAFDNTERVKLLVEELPTPGLGPALGYFPDETPRWITWLGAVYAEESEAPYFTGIRADTLGITAYDTLGRLDKENPISADGTRGSRTYYATRMDSAYADILRGLANLDIEVIQPLAVAGGTDRISDIFLGNGIEADSARQQMELVMETFGSRLYQTFQGRWRIQHSRTWGETINPDGTTEESGDLTGREKRSQLVTDRGRRGTNSITLGHPIYGLTYNVDPLGNADLQRGRLRKAGSIQIDRGPQEEYLRDYDFDDTYLRASRTRTGEAGGGREFRHWTLYSGDGGYAYADGNGNAWVNGHSAVSQAVMRISPADAWVRVVVSAVYHDQRMRMALLLDGDDGKLYSWRERVETDPRTGRPYRIERWEEIPQAARFPYYARDFAGFEKEANGLFFNRRTFKKMVPLSRLPANGTLHFQIWGGPLAYGKIRWAKLQVTDDDKNDVSFTVTIGDGGSRESIELKTIEGMTYQDGPIVWEDLYSGLTYPDVVGWQGLDIASIRGVDSTKLDGRLRRIVPPEAVLQATNAAGDTGTYTPISLQITAAPFEGTSGTWLELPPS